MNTLTVYVSIGNSDDRLPQRHWAEFCQGLQSVISEVAEQVYGFWHSEPVSRYQNACACFEVAIEEVPRLRKRFALMAGVYDQESIAWAEICDTQFIRAEL